mmetsp:Transcript_11641/g.17896  ORF Transcript_11641/g.17896 Transcript_11641/m.17896 type:complete len:270 (-) Transcript_11641:372-1181(-)|eukprot:CAMPEP_0194722152 /NCGR_PEP_ID=MMETSP0296-20130528/13293_1 /TAXON_ID=39354 /ORGANISM="Heterosigma akashiwo, Strain CCMP2393" /LENGTH=269 /DNA_ID=CAMNT_0039625023 /DNA_START=52 /DNA_END=861 /DNA_ORIENTATION=-
MIKLTVLLAFMGILSFVNGFQALTRSSSNLSRTTSVGKLRMIYGGIKAEDILKAPKWPAEWPFTKDDFKRMDEEEDTVFYQDARLVYHIDDPAVGALTRFYKETFPEGADVLDICSSWVSHFPEDWKHGRRSGTGMNEYELSKNPQLDDYFVRDLNVQPELPYEDESFDLVTCVVSVDYLNQPLAIFDEVRRVLRPGGRAVMSMSNRCFPTKAINIWLQTNDLEHLFIVGSYFHYAGGFNAPEALDISPNPGRSDPMYIVQATKKKGEE